MAGEVKVTEKQLVIFNLGGEAYGLDIGTVREIIQLQAVTNVPGAAHSVEGVINLRGSVIPVVDLRKRFGLQEIERGKETRIVVISSAGQDIGIIVDSVTEVFRISSDSIEPPSSTITTEASEYLLGIVKLPDRLIILLDAEKVVTRNEMASLTSMAREGSNGSPSPADKEEVLATV